MKREYLDRSVYDAVQDRFDYLFQEFENIYVSFSGGKDSGLLLNLLMDYKRAHYPHRVIGLFHQDFEAQYTVTTEYVTRTFERLLPEVAPYWVCLPMATRTALSSYEMFWYPWDDRHPELWVRPMPNYPYVINMERPFNHYRYRMHQEDLAKQFGRFYKEQQGGGKTVCLLGMRASESLQRYSAFLNKKYGYKGECWISKQFKDVWCASPLYDWTNSDVWVANARFGYDYNRLYDLYYQAGLKIDQMRVASPFNDYSKDALNLYRVIDPEIWTKLVGLEVPILALSTAAPRPWVTAISLFLRAIHGSPILYFYWIPCQVGFGKTMSKNLSPLSDSGVKQGVAYLKKPSGSLRNTGIRFKEMACPTIHWTRSPVLSLPGPFRTIQMILKAPRIYPVGRGCVTAS